MADIDWLEGMVIVSEVTENRQYAFITHPSAVREEFPKVVEGMRVTVRFEDGPRHGTVGIQECERLWRILYDDGAVEVMECPDPDVSLLPPMETSQAQLSPLEVSPPEVSAQQTAEKPATVHFEQEFEAKSSNADLQEDMCLGDDESRDVDEVHSAVYKSAAAKMKAIILREKMLRKQRAAQLSAAQTADCVTGKTDQSPEIAQDELESSEDDVLPWSDREDSEEMEQEIRNQGDREDRKFDPRSIDPYRRYQHAVDGRRQASAEFRVACKVVWNRRDETSDRGDVPNSRDDDMSGRGDVVEGQSAQFRGNSGKKGRGKGPLRCSCSKSRCLKKYCECFASERYCADCYCKNCLNVHDSFGLQDFSSSTPTNDFPSSTMTRRHLLLHRPSKCLFHSISSILQGFLRGFMAAMQLQKESLH